MVCNKPATRGSWLRLQAGPCSAARGSWPHGRDERPAYPPCPVLHLSLGLDRSGPLPVCPATAESHPCLVSCPHLCASPRPAACQAVVSQRHKGARWAAEDSPLSGQPEGQAHRAGSQKHPHQSGLFPHTRGGGGAENPDLCTNSRSKIAPSTACSGPTMGCEKLPE